MKTNKLKNIYISLFYILFGLVIGWFLFGSSSSEKEIAPIHSHDTTTEAEKTIWTCSMHPQIRMDEPGSCPLCGMDLIPVKKSSTAIGVLDPNEIVLSEEAMALSNVETSVVHRQTAIKELQLYGSIQYDERLLQTQPTHVAGRIEQLNVSYEGQEVRKGTILAHLYSPSLVNAQKELLEALKMKESQPQLVEAAREKLRNWKFTAPQIKKIEETGKISSTLAIRSNTTGVVLHKYVTQGDYVQAGSKLFAIANVSKLWAQFDAYASDLPFLRKGDPLIFTLNSMPGKKIKGRISFIDPVMNATTRTARVRVEIVTPDQSIKPEMYAMAYVRSALKGYKEQLIIPQSAVLWTGKRSIVYVKNTSAQSATFELREIELGPFLGSQYVVMNGLQEGEEIVTHGTFVVDVAAQLEGKSSMMNRTPPVEEKKETTKHAMLLVQGQCGMCKNRIEQAALAVRGVQTAVWDLDSKMLHLSIDSSQTTVAVISKAIAAVGHDTETDIAPSSVYQALPACCLYRK
ncbi:MAG: efflux RND transporter periplasmic adaptor subunit [Bacteroidaceae bacterium]